jgi:ferritin-like metal-binding protein YciE
MNELTELFLDELADIYNAETQLTKALPKMAKAANSDDLREAFESHLAETKEQIERLKQVFQAFDKTAKGKKCKAMEGLLAEGEEILSEHKDSVCLDAALISAAQKVEHYEIASYGCLATWAKLLGNDEAVSLLQETLDEEKQTDEKLTELAESQSNLEASGDESEDETGDGRASSQKSSSAKRQVRPGTRRSAKSSQ